MLALGAAAGFVIVWAFPGYETSTKTNLEAVCTSEITYSLLMEENPVYDSTKVDGEKYYLKPFTRYVNLDCKMNIATDKDADIECTTRVYGLLISEIVTEDGVDIVWQKRYDYQTNQTKSQSGTNLDVGRYAYVNLKNYDELADLLIEEYNIYTDYYLRIIFESDILISFNGETKTEQVTSYVDVPFTDNVMEIENNSPTSSNIFFSDEISAKKEANKELVFLFLIVFAALMLCLIIVVFRTKGVDKKDTFTFEKEKIFKEYGNRLAGLTDTLTYQSSVMISIEKIEDMVKIADEIGQTIFYFEVDAEEERKIEFYVFDEGRIYYLVIFGTLIS